MSKTAKKFPFELFKLKVMQLREQTQHFVIFNLMLKKANFLNFQRTCLIYTDMETIISSFCNWRKTAEDKKNSNLQQKTD
jgi:hypothetical protein